MNLIGWIHRITGIVALAAFILFVAIVYLPEVINADPEIFCKNELVEASVENAEEELMKNVIANDRQDGDLSSRVIIESISPFDADMARTVVFAVADSSGRVSKTECRIKYTDFHGLRFSLSEIERYKEGSSIDPSKTVKAFDLIDGDVSDKIRVLTNISSTEGIYTCRLAVTTSYGETSEINIIEQVVDGSEERIPSVNLTDYILYLSKGDQFEARKMIRSVESNNLIFSDKSGFGISETLSASDVAVSGTVDTDKPGEYIICYSVVNGAGVTGYSYLTVIVGD